MTPGLSTPADHASMPGVVSLVRRLLPEPATDCPVTELYADDRHPPAGRPWVMVTMIVSLDGATAVGGTSGPLGNDTDSAVLAATRTIADVIIVGAGTVRAERYKPARRSGLRIGVVTRSGDVDAHSELFTSGCGFLIVAEDTPTHGLPAVAAGRTQVDLAGALAGLDAIVPGASVVGCEGGPRLNAALATAGLIDEVNLTISPRLAGGDSGRPIVAAPELDDDLEPVALAVDADGFVFSRWRRRS